MLVYVFSFKFSFFDMWLNRNVFICLRGTLCDHRYSSVSGRNYAIYFLFVSSFLEILLYIIKKEYPYLSRVKNLDLTIVT